MGHRAEDQPLSSHGVGPTHVQIDLLDGTEPDAPPKWLEHPRLGRRMDVVALPLRVPSKEDVLYVPWKPKPDSKLWVTEDVSIVGYPYGLNSNNLPIWVRGTVASEPALCT